MSKFSYIRITIFFFSLIACNSTMKITDGKSAFDRKQYYLATTLLEKEYKAAKSRVQKGKIAWLLGNSYASSGRYLESSKWFKTAYDNQYGVQAYREYAFSLKKSEQYKEAEQSFKLLGQEIGSPFEYRKEITASQTAAIWKANIEDNPYKLTPLNINTRYAEYAPSLSGKKLYFSSDRPLTDKDKNIYNWTGRAFSDLFVRDNDDQANRLELPINTAANEGSMSFSSDGNELIFTRCFDKLKADQYCKLLITQKEGDSWSEPKLLDFIQEQVNYEHPTLSDDDRFLYFSSNDPVGTGGFDIYVSERISNTWSQPKLLPRSINTSGNEKFPFIDADTLYFSSDAHTGMGGLDIFRVYKTSPTSWSSPINLQAPINSGADDFGFVIDKTHKPDTRSLQKGYLSSDRPGGLGSDDIYEFNLTPYVEKPKPKEPGKITLDVYVLEKIYQNPGDPNSLVLARKPLTGSDLTITEGKNKNTYKIGEDGLISIPVEPNKEYKATAAFPGYLTNSQTFSSIGISPIPGQDQNFELEVVLDKLIRNKEITLQNIYYDFDKWDIRPDALPTLNELTTILVSNPTIKIRLGSHTDCRGTSGYNQDLSQKRAQSAVDYLISKGIAPERLSAVGYGESVPAVKCDCSQCTEEEYQINRRTTFTILE